MSGPSQAVFLSYASQDAEAARRICESLRSAGVEVWFDQSELVGGDAWDAKIRKQIKDCALFVPLISAHTQARREGYFRLEWRLAAQRSHMMSETMAFLFPVVVDETRDGDADVPAEFKDVQWTRLPAGDATDAFCARVRQLCEHHAAVETAGGGAASVSTPPRVVATKRLARRTSTAVVVGLTVGAAVIVALLLWQPWQKSPGFAESSAASPVSPSAGTAGARDFVPVVAPEKSIAVLPFANMSEDKARNAVFTDGVHEEILTNLAHVRELRVVSRVTVEQYRDAKKTLRQIGSELGVAWILLGSVRRSGERVVLTGQLINARTDEHVWAETFDRNLTEIFAIQSELAQKITASLMAVLSPREQQQLARRPTENLAAYDLYLQALQDRSRGRSAYYNSARFAAAAVKLDPSFVEAWGYLLRMESYIYRNYEKTAAQLAKCQEAHAVLLRLAPDSPVSMLPIARYHLWCLADFTGAIKQTERFIQLQPNDPEGYFLLEVIQYRQGKLGEAIANLRKSIALEPTNVAYRNMVIGPLALCRRHDELLQEMLTITRLEPESANPFEVALIAFRARGEAREVENYFASLPADQVNAPAVVRQRMSWAEIGGNAAESLRLEEQLRTGKSAPALTLDRALVHAAAGELAAARSRLAPLEAKTRQRLVEAPTDAVAWREAAMLAAFLGQAGEAERCLRELDAMEIDPVGVGQTVARNVTTRAFVHAWTGDKPRAIDAYARALQNPYARLNVHEMKRHPRYAPLHGDRRWDALLNDPRNNAPLF